MTPGSPTDRERPQSDPGSSSAARQCKRTKYIDTMTVAARVPAQSPAPGITRNNLPSPESVKR